jgi:2-aminoadipate transaminase
LPEHQSTRALLQEAIKEKVAFVPGESFYPLGGGQNTMRLNFSYAKPEMIREGIRRLGKVLSVHASEKVAV